MARVPRANWKWIPIPALLCALSVPFWPELPAMQAPSAAAAPTGTAADTETPAANSETGRKTSKRITRKESRRQRRRRLAQQRKSNRRHHRRSRKPNFDPAGEVSSALPLLPEFPDTAHHGAPDNGSLSAAAEGLSRTPEAAEQHLTARKGPDAAATTLGISTLGNGRVERRADELKRKQSSLPADRRVQKAQGRIPQRIARLVLDDAQQHAQYCYERELETHPKLSGRVIANLVVAPDGKVARASISDSTLHNGRAEACMLRVVRGLQFPDAQVSQPTPLTYTWRFGNAG